MTHLHLCILKIVQSLPPACGCQFIVTFLNNVQGRQLPVMREARRAQLRCHTCTYMYCTRKHCFCDLLHRPLTMSSGATSNSEGGRGYEIDFTDPPDDLVCTICRHVANEAHQVECCGRVFCQVCIKGVDSCPDCHASTLRIFRDRVSARRIKQLRLSCKNEDRGCDWSGILDEYDAHIAECGFVVLDCPNEGCADKIPRNLLDEHLSMLCRRRLIDCTCCKEKVAYEEMSEHPEKCLDVEVTCDNSGCSVKLYRRELQDHKDICRKSIISCPFSEVGCEVIVLRADLQKHLREYSEVHCTISKDTIVSIKRELSSARKELDSKCVPPLVYKMTNYGVLKANKKTWSSPYFYTHPGEYKMKFRVYPGGCEEEGKDYLSVFIFLSSGPNDDELVWPFDGSITISILNQSQDSWHHSREIDWRGSDASTSGKPVNDRSNSGWGKRQFISHSYLELVSDTCRYVKDDYIYFQVSSIRVRSSHRQCYWLVCSPMNKSSDS